MEEFKDFRKFILRIEADEDVISKGICKVIPPEGWFQRDYDTIDITIPNPIRQCVAGRAGVFEVNLFEVKPMNLHDFQYFASHNFFECDSFQERERKFWRSLGVACAWDEPLYGADYVGSLFGNDKACSWNVNDLDSILTLMGSEVPGVSNAMLYIGTWRAMFAYHVEDMNLYSINYVHLGASKSWYSIPQKYKSRFENMAQAHFYEDYRECHEFLRHKTKLFSPSQLKENGIEYNMVVQNAGEFVITFPGAYHAGFNHGYNIAEATNFATPRWIEHGRKAKRCVCRPFSVSIDMDLLETLFLRQVFTSEKSKHRDFKLAKRMRCACGKNPPLDDPSKPVDTDLIFCCTACHLYCHKECIYQTPAASRGGSGYHDVKEVVVSEGGAEVQLLCHICYSLENEGRWTPTAAADAAEEKAAAAADGGAAGVAKTQTQVIQNSLQNALVGGAKKRARDRQYFKLHDTISISTPGTDEEFIASIVDMEDGLARVHAKGTKRENDVWVTLDDTCRVIIRDGVSMVPPEPTPVEVQPVKKAAHSSSTTPASAKTKVVVPLPVVTPLYPDALFETLQSRLVTMLQKMPPRDFRAISDPVFALCRFDAASTTQSVSILLDSLDKKALTREVSSDLMHILMGWACLSPSVV